MVIKYTNILHSKALQSWNFRFENVTSGEKIASGHPDENVPTICDFRG
jgi:hypothetical protein